MNAGVVLLWSFLLGSIATSALLCVFRLQDIKRILERDRDRPSETTRQGHAVFPFSQGPRP